VIEVIFARRLLAISWHRDFPTEPTPRSDIQPKGEGWKRRWERERSARMSRTTHSRATLLSRLSVPSVSVSSSITFRNGWNFIGRVVRCSRVTAFVTFRYDQMNERFLVPLLLQGIRITSSYLFTLKSFWSDLPRNKRELLFSLLVPGIAGSNGTVTQQGVARVSIDPHSNAGGSFF